MKRINSDIDEPIWQTPPWEEAAPISCRRFPRHFNRLARRSAAFNLYQQLRLYIAAAASRSNRDQLYFMQPNLRNRSRILKISYTHPYRFERLPKWSITQPIQEDTSTFVINPFNMTPITQHLPLLTWATGDTIAPIANEAIEYHMDCAITKAFGEIRAKPDVQWLGNGVHVSHATVVELYALTLLDRQPYDPNNVIIKSLDDAMKQKIHIPEAQGDQEFTAQLLERRRVNTYNVQLCRHGGDRRGLFTESLFHQLNEFFGRKLGIGATMIEKKRRCFVVSSLQDAPGIVDVKLPLDSKHYTLTEFCAKLSKRFHIHVSIEIERKVPDLFPAAWLEFSEPSQLNEHFAKRGLKVTIEERKKHIIRLTQKNYAYHLI